MKRVIFSLLLIVMILCDCYVYTKELLLDGKSDGYMVSCIIPSPDGNPLKYMIFNLFDNDLKTAIAVNSKYKPYKEAKFPYFRIWFKKPYPVDKIVIYNGFQKSDELYFKNGRAKLVSLYVLNHTEKVKGKEYSISLETNILLDDVKDPQVINLPNVSGEHWVIHFQSTYPGTGSDDICISEMELWYKGEKYEVVNLEEAKREYLGLLRDRAERYMGQISVYGGYEVIYKKGETKEKIFGSWSRLGINTNVLFGYELPEGYRENTGKFFTYLYVIGAKELSSGNTTFSRGSICIGRKKVEEDEEVPHDMGMDKSVIIGEYKIDPYGNIWIKIGKGKWKRSLDINFKGTDLGEIESTSWIMP